MNTKKDNNSPFRIKALQYKSEGWLGPARLHIPSSLFICTVIGVIIFFVVVLIIIFGRYSERINITGAVVYDPPAVSLIAQHDGLISSSSALEGKIFASNTPIFTINSDTETHRGPTNVELINLLRTQRNLLSNRINLVTIQSEENRQFLSSKISIKKQEIKSLEDHIQTTEKHKIWFEEKSNLYTLYRGKGIALDSEVIERQKDYYSVIENFSAAKVKLLALQGELLDLQKKLSSVDQERDDKKESLSIEIANIDQKILEAEKNKEIFIIAPFTGRITSIIGHAGERVTAGQRIAVFIPQNAVARVELLARSDSLGEVARGQKVKMRIAAYPYQWYGKIPGIVEMMSVAPMNISPLTQVNDDDTREGLFRIMVKPELKGQQATLSLLPGMTVHTEIYLKTRKIYQWLFIPIKRAYQRATENTE